MLKHFMVQKKQPEPQSRWFPCGWLVLSISLTIGAAEVVNGADPASLDPHLEPLRPLLEKTWKGTFKNSNPDKPIVDVTRWERALNGKAVRILHSVNDGIYGGETLVMWDAQKQEVTYHYFTTAGFRTEGTMTLSKEKVITLEQVKGMANGVTEVRGTTEILPDGTFQVKTEHKKEGEWQPGREVIYREDATAKVVFR